MYTNDQSKQMTIETPFSPARYQLPKIYLHFQKKNPFIKSDTFDFKSLQIFPATTVSPPLSSHDFK